MSYRRFTDSRGTTWRAWDVVPTPVDRRLAVRRIQSTRVHEPERRLLPERRADMWRSRLYFPATQRPWLCFESADSRRRLSPVPADWATRTDAELETLCAGASEQAFLLGA